MEYKFSLVQALNLADNAKAAKEIQKLNTKSVYFDVLPSVEYNNYIFANFTPENEREKMIFNMFNLSIYSFIKKNDTKVFSDLIFKVKEDENFRLINLIFNDKYGENKTIKSKNSKNK